MTIIYAYANMYLHSDGMKSINCYEAVQLFYPPHICLLINNSFFFFKVIYFIQSIHNVFILSKVRNSKMTEF